MGSGAAGQHFGITGKGITPLHVTSVEATLEPGHALLRSSVIERFGHDVALATLLQRVVANLPSSIESFFEIAPFQQPLLIGGLAPDTGKQSACNSTRTDIWFASTSLILFRAPLKRGRTLKMFWT